MAATVVTQFAAQERVGPVDGIVEAPHGVGCGVACAVGHQLAGDPDDGGRCARLLGEGIRDDRVVDAVEQERRRLADGSAGRFADDSSIPGDDEIDREEHVAKVDSAACTAARDPSGAWREGPQPSSVP
jgi:hypothetical protein